MAFASSPLNDSFIPWTILTLSACVEVCCAGCCAGACCCRAAACAACCARNDCSCRHCCSKRCRSNSCCDGGGSFPPIGVETSNVSDTFCTAFDAAFCARAFVSCACSRLQATAASAAIARMLKRFIVNLSRSGWYQSKLAAVRLSRRDHVSQGPQPRDCRGARDRAWGGAECVDGRDGGGEVVADRLARVSAGSARVDGDDSRRGGSDDGRGCLRCAASGA